MTEAELLAVAANQARQTTVSVDSWLNTIKTKDNYDPTQARWYKALKALEQVKALPPTAIYGTQAAAAPFAGRGVMLGLNPDVWAQILHLAQGGYLEVVAFHASTPKAEIDLFPCEKVIWCPPEVDDVADIVQAENQPEWNTADHTAPGIVLNAWTYGRLDAKVALVEAYYNEGWGVDFGVFKNYMAQGAKAVIPLCGGYHASGRSNVDSATIYKSLATLPFPGFWMFAGESYLTAESTAVLKAWKPTG